MRKLHSIAFLMGGAFLAYLIWSTGFRELGRQLTLLGWGLVPVMLFEILAEFVHTAGWRFCLSGAHRSLSLWPLFRIRMAGYAINYLTPTAAMGGEVTRAALLSATQPGPQAVSGVLLGKLCFALAHLIFVACGSVLILWRVHLPPALWVGMCLSGALVGGGVLGFLVLQKYGRLGVLVRWLAARKPGGFALQRTVREITEVDHALKGFYRERPLDLVRSVSWHQIGYALGIFQTWLFFQLLNQDVSLTTAASIWFLGMWFDLLTFAVPLNLGTLEGTRTMMLRALGYAPLLGMTYGVALRFTQLGCSVVGLALYWGLIRQPARLNKGVSLSKPSAVRTGICILTALSSLLLARNMSAGEMGEPSPIDNIGAGPCTQISTNLPPYPSRNDDGWPDLSRFIDQSYGFAPVAMPITEPAIDYGAAGGLAFIDKPTGEGEAGFARPNITAVGGLGTKNGTWGVMAGDLRHWLDDRLQTLVGVGYASVNLDFYGVGENGPLQSNPLTYNLEPLAGGLQAKYRLGGGRWWTGLGYAIAVTQIEFEAPSTTSGLPLRQGESRVGGLSPTVSYDSRDTIFTPTRGTLFEATAQLFSEALGADGEFQRANMVAMHFLPLHSKLTLGLRGDVNLSFGDAPFYMRPFVHMRGAQAMRYQGEHLAQAEAELRWQFWKRFSLLGFAGGGLAWNNFEYFDNTHQVVTGGGGFRYELARKYGLHMGLDVAFGPDEPIFYVQFGSAWLRP